MLTDSETLEWMHSMKQGFELMYDEFDGWIVEDILDRRFIGETINEAVTKARKGIIE